VSDPAAGPSILAFVGLGLLNALCLLAGIGLGWLVDAEVGTLPLFLFVGLAAGIVVGIVATRAELRHL